MSLECSRLLRLPRDLPLWDLTEFELVSKLEETGWAWHKLKKDKHGELPHPYRLGAALLWYTAGSSERSVLKPYLRCLLTAQQLNEDFKIECVPHGRTKEVYEKKCLEVWLHHLRAFHAWRCNLT